MYISTVITLSRPKNIPSVLRQLEKVIKPTYTHELIIGIDNRKISEFELERELAKLPNIKLFKNIEIFTTGKTPPRLFGMAERRTRITHLHTNLQQHIGGSNFVFGFEDDTILPNSPIERLVTDYQQLSEHAQVGMIEGVQVGRWGKEYIGAWQVDNPNNPQVFTSYPYQKKGITEIDAGGFYCFLTPTDLYKSVTMHWREPMGPDFWYGLALKRKGFNNYMDYALPCGHLVGTDTELAIYPNERSVVMQVTVEKNRTKTKAL